MKPHGSVPRGSVCPHIQRTCDPDDEPHELGVALLSNNTPATRAHNNAGCDVLRRHVLGTVRRQGPASAIRSSYLLAPFLSNATCHVEPEMRPTGKAARYIGAIVMARYMPSSGAGRRRTLNAGRSTRAPSQLACPCPRWPPWWKTRRAWETKWCPRVTLPSQGSITFTWEIGATTKKT